MPRQSIYSLSSHSARRNAPLDDAPEPRKAKDHRRKHRLVPHVVPGPIVLEVFEDYCPSGIGLGEIADKLNRNLDRYPPLARNARTRCRSD